MKSVSIRQAKPFIVKTLLAGLCPMIAGSPGCAKSATIHEIAEEYNLHLIDIRLSTVDPSEMNGFGMVVDGIAKYVPFDVFPIEGTPLPKGKDGFIIFLDELTSAAPAVQASAYRLILDRMVGQHKLHPKCLLAAAGNLITDGAIVHRQSTALSSRMVHFKVEPNVKEWIEDFALPKGVDYRVIGFAEFKPELLTRFDPAKVNFTFPCLRTYEFLSRLIKGDSVEYDNIPLYQGAIGEGAATEFVSYCKVYKEIPSLEEILADPTGFKLPTEPSTQLALSNMIASNLDATNAPVLIQAIERLDVSMQVATMIKTFAKRIKDLEKVAPINEWIIKNQSKLI